MSRSTRPSAQRFTEDEIIAFAALLDDWSERTEHGLSLEHVDGFLTALACGLRDISPKEYLPVLLGEAGLDILNEPDARARLQPLLERRTQQIRQALATPIESLRDAGALDPLIMDWQGLMQTLSAAELAEMEADGVPEFASVWAAGFLQVVDAWQADWGLPADSKDEAFVDERLEPFYVLVTPADELSAEERNTRREDYVAMAIWSAYELHDFWRDRGGALSSLH